MFSLFKKRKKPENVKEVAALLEKLEARVDGLSKEFFDFREKSKSHAQKIGVVRFNPFREVGGNQSFCIALLDGENNGFVITSLYEREKNRVYAKPIQRGESKYQLSKEEKEAIQRAQGS